MRLPILFKLFHSSIYFMPVKTINPNNIDPKIVFIANNYAHKYIHYNKIYNLNNQIVSSSNSDCHFHPFLNDQYFIWKQKKVDHDLSLFCAEYNKIHTDVDTLYQQATKDSPIFVILDHYWLSPSLLLKYPDSDYLILSDDVRIHDTDFVMTELENKKKI